MPRLSDVSETLKWIDSSNLEGNGRKAIESLLCNSHFQLTPEARKSGSRKSTRGTAYDESSVCVFGWSNFYDVWYFGFGITPVLCSHCCWDFYAPMMDYYWVSCKAQKYKIGTNYLIQNWCPLESSSGNVFGAVFLPFGHGLDVNQWIAICDDWQEYLWHGAQWGSGFRCSTVTPIPFDIRSHIDMFDILAICLAFVW